MKEAMFWEKKDESKKIVQCHICPRNCVIKEGQLGFCRARKNVDGTLYSIAYGKVANGLAIDPIEKKPFYHFLPGSTAMSFGTAGCNLRCSFCQNWEISQKSPDEIEAFNVDLAPEDIVEEAVRQGCDSIAYTYTEPTIFFEFVLDTAKLAKKRGIKNVIVSNGFINPEPRAEWSKYLDGANIDMKGNDAFYRRVTDAWLKPVQDTIVDMKKRGVWVEVTTLIIPKENDDDAQIKELMDWFEKNVGYDTPWHFTGFYPCYKMMDNIPTPEKTLIDIRKKGLRRGFKYVYAGNILNVEANTTYCPHCKEALITRVGFSVKENKIKGGKCFNCKTKIDGLFSTKKIKED